MANYVPNLKTKYNEEVAPALMAKFGYKSVMQIPRLDKIVVNVGCGEARDNSKALDSVVKELGMITGQKAIITKAKKSVANFKLREGMPIGAKVTLRGDKMWSSWIACSTWLCPVSATSAAFPLIPLTSAATMPWA
jgi:large subunit ribosomal protein L5